MVNFKCFLAGFIIILFTNPDLYSQSECSPEITADDIQSHIYYLASDLLGGRYSGSEGSFKAACYIRNQFRNAGMKLIGNEGFQEFEIISSLHDGDNNTFLYNGHQAKYGIDFAPVYGSKNAILDAALVFAGYGFDIREDSLVWCDYDAVDVTGKWILLFKGYPGPREQENPFIRFSRDDDKISLAINKGAAGIIFIDRPGSDFNDDEPIFPFLAEDLRLDLPAIRVTPSMADNLLRADGWEVDSLKSLLNVTMAPHSMQLTTTVEAETDIIQERIKARNVVALLEGCDPVLKDSYIIVGAHYDHLGFKVTSEGLLEYDSLYVHNGADDNASGTAGVLELAAMLAFKKAEIKRSILFIAFDGEECLLRGSRYFVSNPLVDLTKVSAMINLDMIGRLKLADPVLMAGGIGTASESEQILLSLDTTKVKLDFFPQKEVYSDEIAFYQGNVPVFFFTSGMHDEYHTSDDDWNKINFEGEKDVLEMVRQLILHLANMDKPLTYQANGQ